LQFRTCFKSQIGAIIEIVEKTELETELAFVLPSLPQRFGLLARMADGVRRSASHSTSAPSPRRAPAPHDVKQSASLSLSDQWAKLTGILAGAVSHSENAQHLQKAATQQLDLAQYGLSTLIDELAAVMAVDGRRDRLATLHVFGAGLDSGPGNARRNSSGHALAA
jgi:hypothetical protein